MNTVTLRAYAKINLSLDVTGKREDGYHLLESVFQGISLYDGVRVHKERGAGGIKIRCNLPYIPTDERNIAHKVATAFFKAAEIEEYQITIDLKKVTPSGAGFGGGSADGAAVFSALCRLYHQSFSKEEATAILTPLGADIPFFLYSGTMMARGIGEILTPAPRLPDCFIVLAKPKTNVSTKQIFQKLKEEGIQNRPDTKKVLEALQEGDLYKLAEATANVLEGATIPYCPKVQELKDILKENGAILSMMSGSGSGVFGIFDQEDQAKAAAKALRRATRFVYIARPICRPMHTCNSRKKPSSEK